MGHFFLPHLITWQLGFSRI